MIVLKPMDSKVEWDWMSQRAHPMQVIDTQGIVAYENTTGKICGMVVMDSWTTSGCQTHIAIDNPMCIRAGLLRDAFYHIHITCDRRYCFGLVPQHNQKAYDFDIKMGFEEVARIPEGYGIDDDYIVIRMDRETNRWLPAVEKQDERAA